MIESCHLLDLLVFSNFWLVGVSTPLWLHVKKSSNFEAYLRDSEHTIYYILFEAGGVEVFDRRSYGDIWCIYTQIFMNDQLKHVHTTFSLFELFFELLMFCSVLPFFVHRRVIILDLPSRRSSSRLKLSHLYFLIYSCTVEFPYSLGTFNKNVNASGRRCHNWAESVFEVNRPHWIRNGCWQT